MCLRTIMFCLIVIVLVECVRYTAALEPTGEGVCVVKLSSRQKRRKSYAAATSKWCGRKKCVVRRYKTETYLTWTNHTVCCNGWQHDSNLDVCLPICSTGCVGGTCVGPNQCQCPPPSYLDPELLNTCVTPTCSPNCYNADCHTNNTCTCKQNYSRYNSTHCHHCNEGYAPDSTLKCSPICQNTCVNSVCTAPNTCTCNNGYKQKNGSVCEPICDCINSVCISPYTCSCFEGYLAVNKSYCEPKCERCDNGRCVSPNNCECYTGYHKVDGVCVPRCSSSCVNGFCSAANVCTCYEGFMKQAGNDSVCVRRCNTRCKSYCDDAGECVKWNCSMPLPMERIVMCCEDWEVDASGDKCNPICRLGCLYGTCVDVDVCQCTPPLVLEKNACVVPACASGCVNAQCVARDTCRCLEGFVRYNETFCIPKCQPGYFNDPIECKPRCDKPCGHGVCSAPNHCACDVGYAPGDDLTCRPKCQGCQHGNCIAPNDCRCHKGYSKHNGVCQPNCDSVCANGICSEPNVCKCHSGYELDVNNKFNCLPICETKCVNATCISPNKCSCLLGYESAGNETACKPICDSCENGDCVSPYSCTCFDGYERIRKNSSESCEPVCTEPCVNGYCSYPDECKCFPDYTQSEMGPNICYKFCDGPCWNGTCDLNGNCDCDRGFEHPTTSNDTCMPIREVDCNVCNYTKELDGLWCDDGTPCFLPIIMPAQPTSLAGLRLGWLVGAVAGLILVVAVIIVIQRLWHKRKQYDSKPIDNGLSYTSVMYTVPNTLREQRVPEDCEPQESCYEEVPLRDDIDATNDTLLRKGDYV